MQQRPSGRKLVVLAACLGSTLLAQTAEPRAKRELGELVTDRPDFTEATETVGPGVFQFENGMTISREKGVSSFSGPELLMRVGVSKRFELRFGGDGMDMEWSPGENAVRGVSDAEIGAKIRLAGQSRFRPAISIIPILSMPTGHHAFTSRGYDPTLKVAWSKDLPHGYDIAGNFNVSSLRTPEGRFRQHAASLTVGHELRFGFSGYAEVFAFSPWEKGGDASAMVNGGLVHAIGRNAQADIRVGRRLTYAGPEIFYGFGFAFRQPTGLFLR